MVIETRSNNSIRGFTLLELMMTISILVVVGFLSTTVLTSSASLASIATAKEEVQASLRDTLSVMTAELQTASKQTNAALTPPLTALAVVNPTQITFQVPTSNQATAYSTPITYQLVNEDKNNNGLLNTGEDTNKDKALTRCIMRTQGANQHAIGASNDISNVQFALNATKDILTITVTTTRAVDSRRHDLMTVTASTQVYLQN